MSNKSTESPQDVTSDPGDSVPFHLETDPFVVKMNGVVSPLLALSTVVTNGLVCLVLLRPHMRTPTNTLLVAIAVMDVLTGVWPLPCYIFFYTLGHCLDPVPFAWCAIVPVFIEYLPTISHTASVWLTGVLAVQRYVCICRFQTGSRQFSRSRVVRVIAVVCFAAAVTHVNRFFEEIVIPMNVTSSNATMTSCRKELVPFVRRNVDVYYSVYYWFRVVFIHLVPCASLLVLNFLLIVTLRSAQRRKVRLFGRQKSDSSGGGGGGGGVTGGVTAESSATTLMLVIVVGVFLVVEFPLAVLFIVYIVQNTFHLSLMNQENMNTATNVVNVAILFSYPVNFFVYCSMSRQFRETFSRMFLSRCQGKGSWTSLLKIQYFSLVTEGESRCVQTKVQPEVVVAVAQTGC